MLPFATLRARRNRNSYERSLNQRPAHRYYKLACYEFLGYSVGLPVRVTVTVTVCVGAQFRDVERPHGLL